MILWLKLLEFVKPTNSGTGPYFREKANEDIVVALVFSVNTFLSLKFMPGLYVLYLKIIPSRFIKSKGKKMLIFIMDFVGYLMF